MSILNELFNEEFSKELNEQQLNELTRPYSRTASSINRAKSAVKGLVGGGQYEQGAEQAGQIANRFFMDFKRYIGSKYGRKQPYVTYNDVKSFMNSKKLDTSALGTNQNMTYTPKDVADLFLKAAQEQVSSGLVPPEEQNPPADQGQANPNPNPQGGNGNSGANPPSNGNSGSNSSLQNILSSLTQEQRTQLLAILSRI